MIGAMSYECYVTLDHLLFDSVPNIGPLISCSELDKFKNCWNKSFIISRILTLTYQQFSNLLTSQRDMSGPRLGTLPNNRWSGGTFWVQNEWIEIFKNTVFRNEFVKNEWQSCVGKKLRSLLKRTCGLEQARTRSVWVQVEHGTHTS
jgi:hypothetical protein